MLQRTKSTLPFWIEDSSLVQIYKRYMNYLLKKDELTLGECFSPFVLVSCYGSFGDIILESKESRKTAFSFLKDFFRTLRVEEILSISDRRGFFESLLGIVELRKPHNFFVATHLAYMVNPNFYVPITPAVGRSFQIQDINSYLRFGDYIRERRIKPIEAFATLHLLYEDTPSKRSVAEAILGVSRERELLLRACELWNEGEFYEAHELLEDVWCLQDKEEVKECYQGVIRLALVLHYLKVGEREKAVRVLRKAVSQLEGCKGVPLNVRELSLFARDLLDKLNREEVPDFTVRLKMV